MLTSDRDRTLMLHFRKTNLPFFAMNFVHFLAHYDVSRRYSSQIPSSRIPTHTVMFGLEEISGVTLNEKKKNLFR